MQCIYNIFERALREYRYLNAQVVASKRGPYPENTSFSPLLMLRLTETFQIQGHHSCYDRCGFRLRDPWAARKTP